MPVFFTFYNNKKITLTKSCIPLFLNNTSGSYINWC